MKIRKYCEYKEMNKKWWIDRENVIKIGKRKNKWNEGKVGENKE